MNRRKEKKWTTCVSCEHIKSIFKKYFRRFHNKTKTIKNDPRNNSQVLRVAKPGGKKNKTKKKQI